MKYRNIRTALLKFTDDMRVNEGNRHANLFLQFDFSKAFDTISASSHGSSHISVGALSAYSQDLHRYHMALY